MHDFYYFLYLGRLFIHLNIIIQVSQHSSIFFFCRPQCSPVPLTDGAKLRLLRLRRNLSGFLTGFSYHKLNLHCFICIKQNMLKTRKEYIGYQYLFHSVSGLASTLPVALTRSQILMSHSISMFISIISVMVEWLS